MKISCQSWVPQYEDKVNLLERVHRRDLRMVQGLEGTNEEQLRAFGLFSWIRGG